MRTLALVLALALTACGPRWDLRSVEDGWTTYRRGRSTHISPLGSGITKTTTTYTEQGTAWVIGPHSVALRSYVPVRPHEQVLVFDHGHWRWCELQRIDSEGRYVVGDASMHLAMPPAGGSNWRAF